MNDAGPSQLAGNALGDLKAELIVVLIFAQPRAQLFGDPRFHRRKDELKADAQQISEHRLRDEVRKWQDTKECDRLEDR